MQPASVVCELNFKSYNEDGGFAKVCEEGFEQGKKLLHLGTYRLLQCRRLLLLDRQSKGQSSMASIDEIPKRCTDLL